MAETTKAIRWERKGEVTVLRFNTSEVTRTNLGQAHEELRDLAERIGGQMLFSLANVEFISSAGISALLWLSEYLRSVNGQLRICEARHEVFEVFKIGRLDKILEFHNTEAEAMSAFRLGIIRKGYK